MPMHVCICLMTINTVILTFIDLLVYIRESQVEEILLNPEQLTIPAHLKQKFDEECQIRERGRQKRREAKRYVDIEITTIEAMKKYPQTPHFGLFEFALSPPLHAQFRISKDATIDELKSIAREYFGVQKDKQRLWKWIERSNDTFRICRPLTQLEDERSEYFYKFQQELTNRSNRESQQKQISLAFVHGRNAS